MNKEKLSLPNGVERAIFIIKPDGQRRKVAGHPLLQIIIGLIEASGLNIKEEVDKRLDETQIRLIYPVLNQPSEYGEQWKYDVIEALQAAPLRALIVEGEAAESKAKIIRNNLRETLTDRTTERGKVIENIAHVSDRDDYDTTYQVLFKP